MKITFVLPGFISIPVGGVKIVHEYANRLARRGHQVTLIYPLKIHTGNPLYALRKWVAAAIDHLHHTQKELYYRADPEVAVLVVREISTRYVPPADAIVAVGWQTAEPIAELPADRGQKFYLLQSFETYFGNRRRVLQTYRLPLTKIAISDWILAELQKIGQEGVGPLKNAVNPQEFFIEKIGAERPIDILFMYHPHRIKAPREGLRILQKLKRGYPSLQAVLVAPRSPVHRIPNWIKVKIRPDISVLRKLYNQSKLFLHTSHWEGWGLPVMEAMACGAAVVAATNRGVAEFLIHGENALLAAPGDKARLGQHCRTLLDNPEQRKKLQTHALSTIKSFDWEIIIDQLETYLSPLK